MLLMVKQWHKTSNGGVGAMLQNMGVRLKRIKRASQVRRTAVCAHCMCACASTWQAGYAGACAA